MLSTGHVADTKSRPWVRSPPIGAVIQAGLLGWVWGQMEAGVCLLGMFPEAMPKLEGAAAWMALGLQSPWACDGST